MLCAAVPRRERVDIVVPSTSPSTCKTPPMLAWLHPHRLHESTRYHLRLTKQTLRNFLAVSIFRVINVTYISPGKATAQRFQLLDRLNPNALYSQAWINFGCRKQFVCPSQIAVNAVAHQCLFNYRKDDLVRFTTLLVHPPISINGGWSAPVPKHSNDYASASSILLYAHFVTSFGFIMPSVSTYNSSTGIALFIWARVRGMAEEVL